MMIIIIDIVTSLYVTLSCLSIFLFFVFFFRPLVFPFFLFYFHFRRWRADWSSRLSIIRDELIGCDDVRGWSVLQSRSLIDVQQCYKRETPVY